MNMSIRIEPVEEVWRVRWAGLGQTGSMKIFEPGTDSIMWLHSSCCDQVYTYRMVAGNVCSGCSQSVDLRAEEIGCMFGNAAGVKKFFGLVAERAQINPLEAEVYVSNFQEEAQYILTRVQALRANVSREWHDRYAPYLHDSDVNTKISTRRNFEAEVWANKSASLARELAL